jgi:hypothetical protein
LHLIDGGVDNLQCSNGEGGGLAGSGLSLGNCVSSFDDGEDGLCLDGRGLLESVSVNTLHIILNDYLSGGPSSGQARRKTRWSGPSWTP